jgi:hypothetical protein
MWLLNVWDNVPMNLKYACQQYFTSMCFLGFISYNKTFILCIKECSLGKYHTITDICRGECEFVLSCIIFPVNNAREEYDTRGWVHFHIILHSINVLGTNQNTRSHRPKIIFHPLGSLAGFPARVIVFWQKKRQKHSERITCWFMVIDIWGIMT